MQNDNLNLKEYLQPNIDSHTDKVANMQYVGTGISHQLFNPNIESHFKR